MPRRSATSLQLTPVDIQSTRLQPPSSLPAAERDLFVELVAANPQHFRASDLPLLTQYVAAAILAERALAELRHQPLVEGKSSPWLAVFEKANRATVALSMRLRLSPQARQPNNPGQRFRTLSESHPLIG